MSTPQPGLPSALPEPFAGDPSQPWTDWLAHYEACATALAWTDDVKLRHLSSRFRGHALATYTSLKDADKATWKDAKSNLNTIFEPVSSQQLYAAQYRNRRQQPGEDAAVYASSLRRLGQFALPNDISDTARDKLLVERYVDGVHDARIRMAIRENWPTSLSAAVTRTLEL